MTVLLCFIAISVNRVHSDPMDILRILTLQLNTGHPTTGWGQQYYPIGQIWTIAVEFQFYLLFPFLALFMRNDGVKTMFGMIAVMLMVKYSLVTFKGAPIYGIFLSHYYWKNGPIFNRDDCRIFIFKKRKN